MHMKKEKSYLLIISQAGKISWWYILRFYVCIAWLSTILAVVIGDENISKIETRLPNFRNLLLGGEKTKPNKKKQKKGHIELILKVPVINILLYNISTTQSYPACLLISEMSLDLQSAPNKKISFTATKIESSDLKMNITH